MEVQEHCEDQTVNYSMVVHNDQGIKAQESTRWLFLISLWCCSHPSVNLCSCLGLLLIHPLFLVLSLVMIVMPVYV